MGTQYKGLPETKIAGQYWAEALLPYDQLPDITNPAWNPDPLVVAEFLNDKGPLLVGLGLAHRSDVGNPHHAMLTQAASHFIAFTDHLGPGHRRVIINEGGIWPYSESLDAAYYRAILQGEHLDAYRFWLDAYPRVAVPS